MTAVRRRLDSELVRRAMAPSRTAAQTLIASGRVRVSGAVAHKPSRMVAAGEPLVLTGERDRFVSRGGRKLDAVLSRLGIDVAGKRALDAGASTGGFVDCLLQRGAAQVIAVDVGRGQLDAGLRADQRVTVRERCNVRHLSASRIGGAAQVVTADLSFISLRTVMSNLADCTAPGGDALLLVKPQFEAGRREAARGKGVIRDPHIWRRVLIDVAAAGHEHDLVPAGIVVSPLRGAAGNVEFFLHCRRFDDAAEGGQRGRGRTQRLDDQAPAPAADHVVGDAAVQAAADAAISEATAGRSAGPVCGSVSGAAGGRGGGLAAGSVCGSVSGVAGGLAAGSVSGGVGGLGVVPVSDVGCVAAAGGAWS